MKISGVPAGGLVRRLSIFLMVCFVPAAMSQLPESALSVRGQNGKYTVWWRSSQAPAEWRAPLPTLESAARWRRLRPGLESASLDLSGGQVGWRVRIILARLDPACFSLQLNSSVIDNKAAWSIDSAPERSALAFNAGQFETDLPWGWFVQDGLEIQPPRSGPLSSALVVDSEQKVQIIDAAEIPSVRSRTNIVLAFQSYPSILVGDGRVPEALRGPGRGVDLEHRDSRLAIGLLRDGRLVVALTRFSSLGSALARLPFGPTTPEMAAIMGALGCRHAMLLDGGLSGQMMCRDLQGRLEKWPGSRSVPLGFIAFPKK